MIELPMPLQLVIDDVGWREGWDISNTGGPFRAGVNRLLGTADYAAVADLGRKLGVRPQCALVACEWDRENVCARYPTTTAQGVDWNNAHRIGPWLEQSVRLFREHAGHIELAMHGVGHEHWENGVRTRAEWLGENPDRPWATDVLKGHIKCFREILAQQGLDPSQGVSFPLSFVPCAFRFLWNNHDPESTGAIMTQAGIRYASTPFSSCSFVEDTTQGHDGGFEHGLVVLDRGNCGIPWYAWDTVPDATPQNAICGIHWPNMLRPDPNENGRAVDRWCEFLQEAAQTEGHYLAKNMAETCSQWTYARFAHLKRIAEDQWELDTRNMPAAAYAIGCVMPPVLRIRKPQDHSQPMLVCETGDVSATWETEAHRFFVVAAPKHGTCRLRVRRQRPDAPREKPVVLRTGTFDCLGTTRTNSRWTWRLRCYGSQTVTIALPTAPTGVRLGRSTAATMDQGTWNNSTGNLRLSIESPDIQGTELELHVQLPEGGEARRR